MKTSLSIIHVIILGLCFEGCLSQQSFTQEPSYTEVNPEADTELLCLVQNIGGECRWQKDGKPLGLYDGKYEWSGDPKTGDCSIIIKNVNIIFDDGVWECQVTSSSFESQDALASSPAKLVIREPPKTYNVLQNKNIINEGSQITVVDSKEETVSCESRESNPAPHIRWFLGDNEEISRFSVQNNETESGDSRRWRSVSVLQYRFNRNDVEKKLTCRIYHPAIVNGYYDSSVGLDVLYKPNVSVRQTSQGLIEEGVSSVTLSCTADSNPPGRVFWKKSGDDVEPTYSETLTFEPVNRKDSGSYICQAENHIGLSEEAIIELNVLYPPKILSMTPSEGITVGVHNRSVLSCLAEGNPLPEYQWLQKLPFTNQVLKRGSEESLVIDDTTYDHQGEYVCEAISFIGSQKKVAQSEPVRMEVRGAPQVLRYSVAKEVEAISGRDVRLEMEVCSDPVPSRTTWDWGSLRVEAGKALHDRYLAEEMVEHPSRDDCYIARLLVKSVSPTDSRRYFLDVENAHGTDRYAVALTVKDPVSMASVIGVVVALLVVFVILVIILLYAYKSQKMCFKDSSKLNKIDSANRSFDPEKANGGMYNVKTRASQEHKNGSVPDNHVACSDKIWPENTAYQVYSPNGYHLETSSSSNKRHSTTTTSASSASSSRTTTPSKSVESVNRLLYAELQFPVTSNYGSMKKRSQHRAKLRAASLAAAAVTSPAEQSSSSNPEDLVTHSYNCQTTESLQLSGN